MSDKIDNDPLLADIEAALELYEISPTRFGYAVAGDPALIKRMRDGMVLKTRRRARVEAGLKKIHEQGGLGL